MRRRAALPRTLGTSFGVGAAAALGVGRTRRDADDLDRPFYGVRSMARPERFEDLVQYYHPRMRREHRYAGRTAVRLWGIPFAIAWSSEEPLDVAVPPDAAPPRTHRVKGRRLAESRACTWTVRGVPVVDPVAALFSCAAELTVDQMIVAIDALLTTASHYPGLGPGRPMTTRESLEERLRAWGRFPGSAVVRAAVPLARERVESPKETETRLLIIRAGLPEPSVQFGVCDEVRLIARVDLAYPAWKIAIEYEGDGHRTDKNQWRRDIRRQRDLEDRGWIVIRLTELDLADGGIALLARIRRAIAARGQG